MDFEFSNSASKDLQNIFDYLIEELANKRAAREFLRKVNKIIENIKDFPEMYEVVDNDFIENKKIRRAPIDNYNFYYIANRNINKITIIRIIYARYNSENILN